VSELKHEQAQFWQAQQKIIMLFMMLSSMLSSMYETAVRSSSTGDSSSSSGASTCSANTSSSRGDAVSVFCVYELFHVVFLNDE
jgi:hypothetical protein